MNAKTIFISILIAVLTLLANLLGGCDTINQDEYRKAYIVEAYLIEGSSLPDIRISTDVDATEFYSFEKTAVSGADVALHKLERDGGIAASYAYQMASKGVYSTTDEEKVEGGSTYMLNITIPQDGNHRIRAESTVPTGFTIEETLNDSLQYKGPDMASALCSPSYYKDRQSYYVLTILNNSMDPDLLTPLYADLLETYEDETDFEELSHMSSGIMNEASMKAYGDGEIKIDMPWSALAFYGPSQVVFSTIDDNMYDFHTSQFVQLSGSNISPGEIYNLKYNIEGAVGIFGSFATDTTSIFIYP